VPSDDPRHRRYVEPDTDAEDATPVELPKGDVTEGVVRIGGTVRRPHQPQSWAVAGYLDHLECAGFDGSPRFLGRDAEGRDVLTFLAGDVAGDPPEPWAATPELLVSVAVLLRRLHEASVCYLADVAFAAPYGSVWHRDRLRVDAAGPALPPTEIISHNDVTQQNVVVRDGVAVGLVDFDLAGPASRCSTSSTPRCGGCRCGTPPTWLRTGRRSTCRPGCAGSPTPTDSTASVGSGSSRSRSSGPRPAGPG
jgi:hypothetical protein